MTAAVFIVSLLVWPALAGCGLPFLRNWTRWFYPALSAALLPLTILLLLFPVVLRQGGFQPADLSIISALLLFAGLIFFVCQRCARPFAEAWHEHQQGKIEEEFK